MRITEAAAEAILEVMTRKGLNPKSYFLEIGIFQDDLGIGFTDERRGQFMQFGQLGVVIAQDVDTTGVVIDFGEIEGRKGLIFLGEEHVKRNNGNAPSPSLN